MKIDVLIASLISVFFLGKATKDVEEKTQLASKTRTILYLVLAIVVGIFYYKTQQVATIYHYINIDKQRETLDKSKHCETVPLVLGLLIYHDDSSCFFHVTSALRTIPRNLFRFDFSHHTHYLLDRNL